MRCITTLLVFTLLVAPAGAEPPKQGALMTGKMLALLCQSGKSDDQFSCQSYIAGVVDYHRLLKSLGASPTVDFCVPVAIPMGTIKTVVTRYLLTRTEHQDFIAAPAVVLSLGAAWPCAKRR